ncbi:PAS domain S-box protein [Clostridium chromiireducens]|uniref:Circadian input-output histidine kinase CikA n=1 Tax=Clostridium chromiireducens TaxID=225345 RepID=A0A1V4IV51_9CLOT|nr:PAS domain S-box protein [Clostridium chromiireducens]OPJ63911.1 autoinducer 2 sensor kinase/phosphatase LuxQ [Clostridium chromiireducens]
MNGEIKKNYDDLQIYQTALLNANDIIILFSSEGKILKVNLKAINSYGYEEDELLSMNIFELRNKEKLDIANTQFEKAKLGEIEFETIHYRKDGSSFPVEVKSIGVEINKGIFVLSIIRDITNRVKNEEEIRKLASLVENTDDAIIGKDLEGVITSWNLGAEKIYGYKREEVLGKHISVIIPEDKINDFCEIMKKIKNGEKIKGFESKRKKKNGELIDVSITVSPIYNLAGKLIGASNITRDVTENKKVEEELREKYEEISSLYEELIAIEEELRSNYQVLEEAKGEADKANQAKSEFLANISHEIRTPMNGIIGVIDLLKVTKLNKNQKEYLEMLSYSSRVLLGILNTILDISKIEAGKFELAVKPFDIKRTLNRITKELSLACNNKNLEASYYIDPYINYNLIGDEIRLNQVLINLVNNAIKFTKSGQIVFKVKKIESTNNKLILEFSVQDTGIGIKEEFKNDIFKRFVQQDMTSTKKYDGTGLGLAISRDIAKLMKGDIWFDSVENKGSTFYFTAEFLMDYTKNYKETSCDLQDNKIIINKTKKILIVEDNEINMKIVCAMVEKLGYEFEGAYDGREALEKLKDNSFDLILMDIQMPELNGYDATKIIRANEIKTMVHIYIIAMTAYSMNGDKERCIEIGMDDYISKPFDIDTLKNTILKYI